MAALKRKKKMLEILALFGNSTQLIKILNFFYS